MEISSHRLPCGSGERVRASAQPAEGMEQMAVAVDLEFDGGALEQYDQVAKLMDYEPGGAAPAGCLFHWGALTERGLRVTDVWESKEQFEQYAREKIGPYTQEVASLDRRGSRSTTCTTTRPRRSDELGLTTSHGRSARHVRLRERAGRRDCEQFLETPFAVLSAG